MIVFVLFAFRGARFTNVGTQATNVLNEAGAPTHVGGGVPADGGAIEIRFNAIRHHGNVLFVQACSRTVLTRLGTQETGLDAILVLMVSHLYYSYAIDTTTQFVGPLSQ